jgi:molecular chaperone GrpE
MNQDDEATPATDVAESEVAASDVVQPADTVESLQEQLAAAQAKIGEEAEHATDYMHRWQRTSADFANFRRRNEQEREDMLRFANQMLVTQLLAVVDNFERAFTTIQREIRTLSWVSGVHLIYQQLSGLLIQQGLEPVDPKDGDSYDPNYHEAVMYEPVDGKEDGTILTVFQTGYRMHGRLLRPALVKVAQGSVKAQTVPPAEPTIGTPSSTGAETSGTASDDESNAAGDQV